MSALLLTADVCGANRHVCFGSEADIAPGLQVSLLLLSVLVRTPDQMQLANVVTIPCE